MAERIADSAEHIVDEMKRRARRRLVGAIVLALGAAIVLPLLLEKEPRPLGDDVSVQIPPIDESKFVNRLTGKSGESKALPKAESKAITAAAKAEAPAESAPAPPTSAADTPHPKKAVADAEQRVLAPTANPAPRADTKAPAAPEPKVDAKSAAKAEAKAAPASDPKGDPKPAVAAASPAPVATPQAPTAAAATTATTDTTLAKAEGFVVQLAAFADDKGANALANKLKKSGYAAYVQPVETSRGTLWRVRVGGYASRPEADAARATLKGEGYSGIIAPAQ